VLAGQPVAVIFAHVGATLGNNDHLYDHISPHSLRIKAKKYGRIWRYAWILAIFGPPAAFGQMAPESGDLGSVFDNTTIIIEAKKDACYRFDVYVASSREQQVRGLMHVRRLPEFSGMLFVYDQPAMLSMWMKNTYLPLDILFIRSDGTIANIVADTEPLSLNSIAATEPVTYVLELNAGVTEKLQIDTESRIHL
jgi:uncharacterized membrane protein (UPF0127 family)